MPSFWYTYTPSTADLRALQIAALPAVGRQALAEGLHPDFVLGLYPVTERDEAEVARSLMLRFARTPERSVDQVCIMYKSITRETDRHMLTAHRPTRYVRYASSENEWEQYQSSSSADDLLVMKVLGPRPSYEQLGFNDGDVFAHVATNANVIAALLVRNPKVSQSDRHNHEAVEAHVRFRLRMEQLIATGA